jgi:hypothetical protein
MILTNNNGFPQDYKKNSRKEVRCKKWELSSWRPCAFSKAHANFEH